MPQKSRYMIAGRPTETPPHFSATSVGSPVVPDVDMIAVSSADGRQSSPPYGSARRSRKWRTASLEMNGTFSRKSSSVRTSAGVMRALRHSSRMRGERSYVKAMVSRSSSSWRSARRSRGIVSYSAS